MKVFVLGGTGSIGAAVVQALNSRRHDVFGLARSDAAAGSLRSKGAQPVRGDIRWPGEWADIVDSVDAIIQVAGDFTPDAASIDRTLLTVLLDRFAVLDREPRPAYIYTGGCWLYGNTGDRVATENYPLNPPSEWAWSVDHLNMILRASQVRGIVIHPAMVYERDGGVLARFRDDLVELGRVRVFGDEQVRWPLVHRTDIGELYALALEQAPRGESYNGAAIDSIPVGVLARAMAHRVGAEPIPLVRPVEEAVKEFGGWARGYAIDQRMSGAKARRQLGWSPLHTDPIVDIS